MPVNKQATPVSTPAGCFFFLLMKDRRPGLSPYERSSSRPTPREAGGEPGPITKNRGMGPRFRGDDRVGFVGFVSPKCAALGSCAFAPCGRGHNGAPTNSNGVRGFRNPPLTHHRARQQRAALSRKGRGHNNCDRAHGRKSHDVKQPISFPRSIFAPGVCIVASLTPNRGVGGAPRNVRVLGGTPVGACT
jgi:hypothetical protein